MHIDLFKYFFNVAKVKSISKVASNSHISQSALSQQIQKLEDGLGYKLLLRSNRGVELTEEGKIVKKYAETIIKTYNKMLEDLNNGSNFSTIRIDSCQTVSTYALPCTLYDLKKKFPNHEFILSSNFSNVVEQNVLNDIIDLGFIYEEPNDLSLAYYKVATDELVLVASEEYNVPEEIEIKDLVKYPLVTHNDKFDIEEKLNSYLSKTDSKNEKLNILFSLGSTESVKTTILKGYGMAFVPYISVKKELYMKQLKQIKVNDFTVKYNIYCIYKKNTCLNKNICEIIKYFKKIGNKSFC